MSGACCCAVQRQRQWLLRCCKSQQWICRPLSGSPCASTSRVSILFGTSWDFLACSSAINPLLLAIPLVCLVRWTCSSLLCCAHIFASTRTGGTEHELLCCKIWPQQCLALWHVLHIGALTVYSHSLKAVGIQCQIEVAYMSYSCPRCIISCVSHPLAVVLLAQGNIERLTSHVCREC